VSNLPKKKKEIVVGAPLLLRKWYDSPEVKAIAERLNFFSICGKISRYSAWPIIGVNLSLFLYTTYCILNSALFSFPKPPLIAAIFSIGIMNIVSGLLLLAKE
jgi:hypothetical protein